MLNINGNFSVIPSHSKTLKHQVHGRYTQQQQGRQVRGESKLNKKNVLQTMSNDISNLIELFIPASGKMLMFPSTSASGALRTSAPQCRTGRRAGTTAHH